MLVRGIVAEDFLNYKLPSMFITSCFCDFKCCVESGLDIGVCQNAPLIQTNTREIEDNVIYDSFIKNEITKAVVIGGMEPFMQFDEVLALIDLFRAKGCNAEFVIYTGYNKDEIADKVCKLSKYNNIIIKYGRYIPNRPGRYDSILGITLASDNQYAERVGS